MVEMFFGQKIDCYCGQAMRISDQGVEFVILAGTVEDLEKIYSRLPEIQTPFDKGLCGAAILVGDFIVKPVKQ